MTYKEVFNTVNAIIASKEWTVVEVVDAFEIWFPSVDRVYKRNQWYDLKELVLGFGQWQASAIDVQFWGGAPPSRKYMSGTLLDMLLDRCYYCVLLGDDEQHLLEFLCDVAGEAHQTC